MADNNRAATPLAHWIISGAALLWNLMGLSLYVMGVSMSPQEMLAQYSPSEIALLDSVPIWATSANAIAVTAGVIASILLLFRKSFAIWFFILSVAGLLVQDLNSFVLQDTIGVFGMVPLYIQITVLVVAAVMILYSRTSKARGIID